MPVLNFKSFFLIAGPCVIESRRSTIQIALKLASICQKRKLPFIFKASYDKANRSSHRSYRGPGLQGGLDILREVRKRVGVPVLTDVHSDPEIEAASKIIDVLQIPAFLRRQTDLLSAAAQTGCWVNVKKGQFLAPEDMQNVVEKLKTSGTRRILLTERGTTFGYHNLVVDFRGIFIMQKFGCPVIFDATHSVQRPGESRDRSGGDSKFAPTLAKAAVAAGCSGLFLETHLQPSRALSDGPNMLSLKELPPLLDQILRIRTSIQT